MIAKCVSTDENLFPEVPDEVVGWFLIWPKYKGAVVMLLEWVEVVGRWAVGKVLQGESQCQPKWLQISANKVVTCKN